MKVLDVKSNMDRLAANRGHGQDQMILRVFEDSSLQQLCEVPITPDTTCADVVECMRMPTGAEHCHLAELWRGCERPIGEEEHPFEILQQWGTHMEEVIFFLRHGAPVNSQRVAPPTADGRGDSRRNGMREDNTTMPSAVDLTLTELQQMAARQQQQIEAQQQMLVAKEQRLKFLKQQELRHQQIASENERLRKLREKVEAQELKLKKLRALRGQANEHKGNNSSLTSELESIKSLFSDKEKELSQAVNKVDELTSQLEELRKGRLNGLSGNTAVQANPTMLELEKLRKELNLRNKLNEQQNCKLAAHREVFQQRKEEMTRMDQRIAELQNRLQRKKQVQNKPQNGQVIDPKKGGRPITSNIAAVEPYIQRVPRDNSSISEDGFPLGKQDPKYQTLPYNMKLAGVEDINNGEGKVKDSESTMKEEGKDIVQSTPTSRVMSHFAPKPYGSYRTPVSGVANPATLSVDSPSVLYTSPGSTVSTKSPPKTSTPVTPAAYGGKMKEIFITGAPVSSGVSTQPPPPRVVNTPANQGAGRVGPPPGRPANQTSSSQGRPANQTSSSQGVSRPNPPSQGVNRPPPLVILPPSSPTKPRERTMPPDTLQQPSMSSTSGATTAPDTGSLDTSPVAVNSALSVLMAPPTTTSVSKPSYRYAPKSVIANTYMSRLGSSALDQYTQSAAAEAGGINTATIQPQSAIKSDTTAEGQAARRAGRSPEHPAHHYYRRPHSPPAEGRYDNYSNGPPPYPGVPPYKIEPHYKPNAPRPLRRRWSITEMDEHPKHGQVKQHRLPSEGDDSQSQQAPDVIRLNQTIPDHYGGTSTFKPETQQQSQPKRDEIPFADEPAAKTADSTAAVKSTSVPAAIRRKNILKGKGSVKSSRRVSFDPLALLLDSSLEGELDLVMKTARQVTDPSASNDEGITALHNAICAGHYDIVRFLVEYGCNVNSPDSDGWTPLHCAASCNNLPMVKFLVEHGACIFATTISDQETAAEKCEEDEDGFDGCSEYLYSIQEKLGILNKGSVYAVFDYEAQNPDELSFHDRQVLTVVRKGDDQEKEWWWARKAKSEGYIPRNLLGLYPRVIPEWLRKDGKSDAK